MLKRCQWKGLSLPCSAIFTMFPTDRGMCCTFNMDKAEALFKKNAFRDNLVKLQTRDKNLSFEAERVVSPGQEKKDGGAAWGGKEPYPEAGKSKVRLCCWHY